MFCCRYMDIMVRKEREREGVLESKVKKITARKIIAKMCHDMPSSNIGSGEN